MPRAIPAVLLVAMPLLSGCQLGPKALSEADKAAIRAAEDRFTTEFLARNFAAVAGEYAVNATLLPPNEPAVTSRAAIQAWLATFPPTSAFKLTVQELDGQGDLAYDRGIYEMTITPSGAPAPISDHGKFVEVRRKGPDGSWSITNDIFNSDLPATPPAPAPAPPPAKHK